MIKNSSDIVSLSNEVVSEFNDFCDKYQLVSKVKPDHICIKCSSKEIYESSRALFEFESDYVYQSIISKRRISVIGLRTKVPTTLGEISYLELSDQKIDNSQDDRVDHIEIVPTVFSYDELVNYLKDQSVEMKEVTRPHHSTHDIVLPSGFIIRLSHEMLVDKIKREEMK